MRRPWESPGCGGCAPPRRGKVARRKFPARESRAERASKHERGKRRTERARPALSNRRLRACAATYVRTCVRARRDFRGTEPAAVLFRLSRSPAAGRSGRESRAPGRWGRQISPAERIDHFHGPGAPGDSDARAAAPDDAGECGPIPEAFRARVDASESTGSDAGHAGGPPRPVKLRAAHSGRKLRARGAISADRRRER